MEKKQLLATLGIIAAIVIALIVVTYLSSLRTETIAPQAQESEEQTGSAPDRITAKHWYIDGTHTVAGEVAMATPCDLLEATATTTESGARIDLTVINNSGEDMACAQVITPARFLVEVDASEDASITATWDGVPVPINLVVAEPGERPEDFELFIKG